jgi:hypothetical protein
MISVALIDCLRGKWYAHVAEPVLPLRLVQDTYSFQIWGTSVQLFCLEVCCCAYCINRGRKTHVCMQSSGCQLHLASGLLPSDTWCVKGTCRHDILCSGGGVRANLWCSKLHAAIVCCRMCVRQWGGYIEAAVPAAVTVFVGVVASRLLPLLRSCICYHSIICGRNQPSSQCSVLAMAVLLQHSGC